MRSLFINRNIEILHEYLMRLKNYEYSYEQNLERLCREKAMIELEIQAVNKNLAYCRQEKQDTQGRISDLNTTPLTPHDTKRNY